MAGPSTPRAVVVGGSIGGLFAASLLRAAGWDARIYERAGDDLAGRGAGVGTTRELLGVMRRIGIPFDPSLGVSVQSYAWIGGDGGVRFEQPRPMVASAWSSIYRPLRESFPDALYETGRAVRRVEQGDATVAALFEDGSRAEGELLVAADGINSTVRRQLAPAVDSRYAGYVAWRGVAEEAAVSPEARRMVGGRIAFSFHEGELMLTMLVPGAKGEVSPGRQRYYFIWYRPVPDETLPELFTDAQGCDHGLSIPPPLIRAELVEDLRRRARDIFAPPLAEVVGKAPQLLLQAISDLEAPRLVFDRAVLLGDAAFVARPHVAAGITKAALNAEGLADALAAEPGDLPAALARYEADQGAFGAAIVGHARSLGAYVETRTGRPLHKPDDERFLDPAEVMREYGAPRLLHDADPAAFEAAKTEG